MKFTKILPYKLRRVLPILGMAGATMVMSGCSKDDNEEPREGFTREFVWGFANVDEIWSYENQRPSDRLLATADSVQVTKIILRVDKRYWNRAYNEREILDEYLNVIMDRIPKRNRGKFTGAGTFWGLREEDPAAQKELREKWHYDFDFSPYSHKASSQNQR